MRRLVFLVSAVLLALPLASAMAAPQEIDIAGVTADIVHVPSDLIAATDPDWGAGLLGDKAHSLIFDNSKLRTVVPGYQAVIPFEQGAREIIAWHDEDPARQQIDHRIDAAMDKLTAAYRPSPQAR